MSVWGPALCPHWRRDSSLGVNSPRGQSPQLPLDPGGGGVGLESLSQPREAVGLTHLKNASSTMLV